MAKITLLIAVVYALIFSCTKGRTFLECSCSPSKRGFRANVLTQLKLSRAAVLEYSNDQWGKLGKKPSPKESKRVAQEVQQKSLELWRSCISNYDEEQCVNADSSLRLCKKKGCQPVSFCKFQSWDWKNIRAGRAAASCDTDPVHSSQDPGIIAGKPEVRTQPRPSNSPSPTPSKRAAIPIPTRNVNAVPNPNNTSSDVSPPVAPTVTPEGSATPFPEAPGLSPIPNSTEPTRANEGCVAIEHLQGFVLQHRQHLLRNVLCSAKNNFCATPNHALIVDGKWTSMKQLCDSSWNCVRTVRLVNNLNVFANRRAVVSDSIIVTPYDLRFPRWGVWLVQSVEIVFNSIGFSGILAAIFATTAIMIKSQKQYQ